MQWDVKLFHCQNGQEALAKGCAHFSCQPDKLRATMVHDPTELDPGLAIVVFGQTPEDLAKSENMDGFVRVDYRPDGVWVERYPYRGKGTPLERRDIERYVGRKGIHGLELAPLTLLLGQNIGMVKVASAQAAVVLNQDVEVRISTDEMEAAAVLLPPDPGGEALSEEGIAEAIRRAGIVFGLNQMAVKFMFSEQRYDKTYTVARGRRAIDGENGKVTYHFRTTLTAAPKVIDERTDKVDFRTLDLFEPVQEDQLLVSRTLATPGTAGMTVTGREIPPKPGREAVLPRGKGVRYDDSHINMYAAISGMVQSSKGMVSVSNVYTVKGNCDMGVGNIDFDGNVEIRGGVLSGMTIRATGNVVVGGVVEGAVIEAGGDIVLRGGVQGMDRAKLIAGGDITALFVERSEIVAGGSLTADVVLHSRLAISGAVRIQGKRGNLVGGTTKAAQEVIVHTLGSQGHTDTLVEVGVMPATRERIDFLRAELVRLETERDKLEKLSIYLEKAGELDATRAKLYNSITDSQFQNAQLCQEYSDELDRLTFEVDHAVDGKVHVLGVAYPGVRLSIASGRLKIEGEIPFATFRYREGEISYVSCEISRR